MTIYLGERLRRAFGLPAKDASPAPGGRTARPVAPDPVSRRLEAAVVAHESAAAAECLAYEIRIRDTIADLLTKMGSAPTREDHCAHG